MFFVRAVRSRNSRSAKSNALRIATTPLLLTRERNSLGRLCSPIPSTRWRRFPRVETPLRFKRATRFLEPERFLRFGSRACVSWIPQTSSSTSNFLKMTSDLDNPWRRFQAEAGGGPALRLRESSRRAKQSSTFQETPCSKSSPTPICFFKRTPFLIGGPTVTSRASRFSAFSRVPFTKVSALKSVI